MPAKSTAYQTTPATHTTGTDDHAWVVPEGTDPPASVPAEIFEACLNLGTRRDAAGASVRLSARRVGVRGDGAGVSCRAHPPVT